MSRLDTFGRFSAIVDKGENFCSFVCFPVHQAPSEKGYNLKGKNLQRRQFE